MPKIEGGSGNNKVVLNFSFFTKSLIVCVPGFDKYLHNLSPINEQSFNELKKKI